MAAKLDIIVMGATGFTGRLTCQYLMRKPELVGRWGIAGRSAAKLDALKEELGGDVPSFVADAMVPEALDAVCAKATCVIACAGPFTLMGMPLVEACVRNGTHYVDSTGEFNFVRQTIEKHHAAAVAAKVAVVSCCGFDCVPADLGNYVVHREAGEELTIVRGYFDGVVAGISNGTLNSVSVAMDATTAKDMDPLSLLNPDGVRPTATPTRFGFWYENGRFTGLSMSAMGDQRVVRRTNSLLRSSAAYVQASQGPPLRVIGSTLAMYVAGLVLVIGPLRRWLINRYSTGTSVGPSDRAMMQSSFHCTFIGETVSGKRVETTLWAKKDVYTVTAIFLAECALSAVSLAGKKELQGGVLTPSFAFGDTLAHRCRDAGINIETVIIGGPAESKKDR